MADAATHKLKPAAPHANLWKVVAAFFAIYVVWGSTYFAIRIGVETLPPLLMAGSRFLCAGTLMLLFAPSSHRRALTVAQWAACGIVGLLMLLGGNGLVCWAESRDVSSGIAALLVGTVPLWMVLLDWLVFRGPRPTVVMLFGLTVGFAGIALLVDPASLHGGVSLTGAAALVFACLFWSLGSLFSRRSPQPPAIRLATALQMLMGGAGLIVASLLTGEIAHFHPSQVSLRSVAALLYLVVFGSIVAFTAYLWLLQVVTTARVATYAYVNPAIALLLGTFLGNEPFTTRTALASAVILAAVVVITRAGKPPRAR